MQNVDIWYFSGGKIQKKVYIYKLYNIQQNCWRSQLFFLDLKIARNSFVCWLVILNKYAKFHSWHFRHFPWLLFFRAIRKILLIIRCPLIFVLFHLNVYKKKIMILCLMKINCLLEQITDYRNSLIWLYNLFYGRFKIITII